MTKTSTYLTRLHKNEGGWGALEVVIGLAIGTMVIGGVCKLGGKVYNWATGHTDTATEHVGKTQQGFKLFNGEAVEVNPSPPPSPSPSPAPNSVPHTESTSEPHDNNVTIVDPPPQE